MNGDEEVNSTDALIILSCDIGFDVSEFCPMDCADVNEDGAVNSTDALIIITYDVGEDIPFSVGRPDCRISARADRRREEDDQRTHMAQRLPSRFHRAITPVAGRQIGTARPPADPSAHFACDEN